MNVLEALAGQLAVQRQLVAPAALEQILATSRGGGGTVSQLLLRGGLLGREALGQLLAAAATSQVVCPACGLSALPQQLAAAAPLDCPRCGGRLLVAETEEATSPPSFPAGRPSSSGSGRRDRHPFTPHGASPLDTRRIAAASGSARFDGDPTGTMRFRRALKEGGTVGPFELLEELGRGGMGVVYKARHTTRDELVALKVLRSGALASKKQRKRFEREVQAMARLDHPNVVPVRDVGRLGDNEYFTMALVDGRSLGDVLKTERLPARRAAEVALDVARGLEHAHQEGIVHRDIKPDNILVDRGGRALITDFGLVHDTDAEERLTRSGALVGTPYYMSPEQARGRRDLLGPQSDVYALGVVLFQMLSGQLPFRAETQLELVEKIVKTPAPAVSSLEPSVPSDLDAVVATCLRKQPDDRYASAGALAADLERFLQGRPVSVRSPRSRRLVVVAGAAVATLLVLGGGYAIQQRRGAAARRAAEVAAAEAAARAAEEARRERERRIREAKAAAVRAQQAALRLPLGEDYRRALAEADAAVLAALDLAPEDALLLLAHARLSEHLHRYPAAEEAYRRAAAADRGAVGAEATAWRAWLLGRQGRPEKELAKEVLDFLPSLRDDAGPWSAVLRALAEYFLLEDPSDLETPLNRLREARSRDPNLTVAWALEARLLFLKGNLAAAESALDRALLLLPREPLFLANRGAMAAVVRRFEDALADAEAALKIDPRCAEALRLRGRIRLLQGEVAAGIADLELALSEAPEDPSIRLDLAEAYLRAEQLDRARRVLSEAAQRSPDANNLHRLQADVAIKLGDIEGALAALREGVLHAKDPDVRRMLYRRLLGISSRGARADFVESFAQALLRENQADPRAFELRAELFAQAEDLDRAEALAREGIRRAPTYTPLHVLLFRIRFSKDDEDQAQLRDELESFLREFASDPDALCYGVQFHLAVTRDLDRARDFALRACKQAPHRGLPWCQLAIVSALAGKPKIAFEHARHAALIDPGSVDALRLLGDLYLKQKKPQAALETWKQALIANPFAVDVLDRYATISIREGAPQDCVRACTAYLRNRRDNGARPPVLVSIHLANAYLELNRPQQAQPYAEQALAASPKEPVERRNLARALLGLGRVDDARALLRRIVEDDPTDRKALELLEAIESGRLGPGN